MNIFLSFILFNPLEAFVLIITCNIFTNNKFEIKRDIKEVYLFGTINLIFQIILKELETSVLALCLNILVQFFISPIILYIYYRYRICKIKIKYCFISHYLYIITLTIVIFMFSGYSSEVYFVDSIKFLFEIFLNITKSIIQIIIIYLIRRFVYGFYKENYERSS